MSLTRRCTERDSARHRAWLPPPRQDAEYESAARRVTFGTRPIRTRCRADTYIELENRDDSRNARTRFMQALRASLGALGIANSRDPDSDSFKTTGLPRHGVLRLGQALVGVLLLLSEPSTLETAMMKLRIKQAAPRKRVTDLGRQLMALTDHRPPRELRRPPAPIARAYGIRRVKKQKVAKWRHDD